MNTKGFSHIFIISAVALILILSSSGIYMARQNSAKSDPPLTETVKYSEPEDSSVPIEESVEVPAPEVILTPPPAAPIVPSEPTKDSSKLDTSGTRAYGKIRFMDVAHEGKRLAECEEKTFKKGTILHTEDGLEFELLEDVNPKCLPILDTDKATWESWGEFINNEGSSTGATVVTVRAIESGRKYEIEEDVVLKVKDEPFSKYAAYTENAFVGGGDTGGL